MELLLIENTCKERVMESQLVNCEVTVTDSDVFGKQLDCLYLNRVRKTVVIDDTPDRLLPTSWGRNLCCSSTDAVGNLRHRSSDIVDSYGTRDAGVLCRGAWGRGS